ncbi:hypothetical protein [Paenibacillus sp. 2003]|uniref:hypothetical protein n=1 Tax=Paenibacillus TaxID=44249 RepID=UPI0028624ACE|nr:hypothetical protein [Paenibacillus sp. 2003]MDR6717342.1 ABC-type glycerol-3-phosphate transport system substrate-binding protein [Paenibacillus sp. 2003]
MKKMQVWLGVCLLVIVMALSGCSTTKEASGGTSGGGENTGATHLVFWTFVDAHQKFYESMAEQWNQDHPERQIALEATTIPYDDMHTKLLLALQSGVGALFRGSILTESMNVIFY